MAALAECSRVIRSRLRRRTEGGGAEPVGGGAHGVSIAAPAQCGAEGGFTLLTSRAASPRHVVRCVLLSVDAASVDVYGVRDAPDVNPSLFSAALRGSLPHSTRDAVLCFCHARRSGRSIQHVKFN